MQLFGECSDRFRVHLVDRGQEFTIFCRQQSQHGTSGFIGHAARIRRDWTLSTGNRQHLSLEFLQGLH